MKAKQRMTKPELICWLESHIEKTYRGNKAAAARSFGVLPAELHEILGSRRAPSKKLLKAIGYGPDDVTYYVRIA